MERMIINMLLGNLRSQNPQAYQQIMQTMNSGGNPQSILKQLLTNSNSNMTAQVLQQAKQFGVPDNVLSQIQNIR